MTFLTACAGLHGTPPLDRKLSDQCEQILNPVPHPIHKPNAGNDGVVTLGEYIGALNEANKRIAKSNDCLKGQRDRYLPKGSRK